MNRNSKSFFTEKKALPFAFELAKLWPKGIAMNWFWLAFQALEKAGLTSFKNEEEEMQVREKLRLITVFYYEFCHISAKHENENFTPWDEDTIVEIKNDFSDEADEYLLEIRNALINYFGGEEQLVAELWINCMEGESNSLMKLADKTTIYNKIIENEFDDVNFEKVRTWFVEWSNEIDDFKGIAIK